MKLDILRDTDIFEAPQYDIPESYEDRQTVKIVILNDKKEVALVTNPIHKIFLLPGGGAESNDLEKEAIRESLEEINYHVAILDKIAELEEFRNRNSKHYFTTCFFAGVIKKNDKDWRTDEEKENGLEVVWLELDEAIEIMSKQVERVRRGEIDFYNTAFNIVRDLNFIQLAKDKKMV